MSTVHPLPALALEIRHLLPADLPVHLVGGAVRDWLLQRPVVDLDFVIPQGALYWARRLAQTLGADVFPLDPRRGIARVLLHTPQGLRVIDISDYRGATLEEDLRARDFTINAMALDPLQPEHLVDPLGGLQDLLERRLRLCSPTALTEDPVRVLRGVRLALDLDLTVLPETRQALREAVALVGRASPERLREELFKTLELPKAPAALRLLQHFGALRVLLPEVAETVGVPLPPDRYQGDDLWEHTLRVLTRARELLQVLLPPYDPDKVANTALAQVTWRLGRFRFSLDTWWKSPLAGYRPRQQLFWLAALYHDVGKSRVNPQHPDPEAHARASAAMMVHRARSLRLARNEIRWLERLVRWHMWPQRFAQRLPQPLDLYRFYREAQEAGPAIGLLHLANIWSHARHRPPERSFWEHHVEVVRRMWEAWWEQRENWVHPRPLLTGDQLIREFGLTPGPELGDLLEALKEAQVAGEVTSSEAARAWVRTWLQQQGQAYGKISSSNGS